MWTYQKKKKKKNQTWIKHNDFIIPIRNLWIESKLEENLIVRYDFSPFFFFFFFICIGKIFSEPSCVLLNFVFGISIFNLVNLIS